MSDVNPYSAPKADVYDMVPDQGRPGWVWAIFIFYAFSAVSTIVSYSLMASGRISLPKESLAYMSRLTSFDYALSFLAASVNLIAAILLFRLRKLSLKFFILAFAVSLFVFSWNATKNHLFSQISGIAFISVPIGYGIKIAICFYVWRLIKRGILK